MGGCRKGHEGVAEELRAGKGFAVELRAGKGAEGFSGEPLQFPSFFRRPR